MCIRPRALLAYYKNHALRSCCNSKDIEQLLKSGMAYIVSFILLLLWITVVNSKYMFDISVNNVITNQTSRSG